MSTSMNPKFLDGFILFSPTFEHLKRYLPDDHEKVYSSHSLKWRFGVKPPNIGPASRSELEHGSFDFPGGGVDVPVRRKQLRWKSREIGGGRNTKPKNCKKMHWLFYNQCSEQKDSFLFERLSNSGLYSQVMRWEQHARWGASVDWPRQHRPQFVNWWQKKLRYIKDSHLELGQEGHHSYPCPRPQGTLVTQRTCSMCEATHSISSLYSFLN